MKRRDIRNPPRPTFSMPMDFPAIRRMMLSWSKQAIAEAQIIEIKKKKSRKKTNERT